eukprot:SAG31_NODE_434_length_15737_cov_10.315450_8_plen_509_part_00
MEELPPPMLDDIRTVPLAALSWQHHYVRVRTLDDLGEEREEYEAASQRQQQPQPNAGVFVQTPNGQRMFMSLHPLMLARMMTGAGLDAGPGREELQAFIQEAMNAQNQASRSKPTAQAALDAMECGTVGPEEVSSFEPCAVCQDSFAVGEQYRKISCGHAYHADCLTPWLKEHNTCPTCRFELPIEENKDEQPTAATAGTAPPGPPGGSTSAALPEQSAEVGGRLPRLQSDRQEQGGAANVAQQLFAAFQRQLIGATQRAAQHERESHRRRRRLSTQQQQSQPHQPSELPQLRSLQQQRAAQLVDSLVDSGALPGPEDMATVQRDREAQQQAAIEAEEERLLQVAIQMSLADERDQQRQRDAGAGSSARTASEDGGMRRGFLSQPAVAVGGDAAARGTARARSASEARGARHGSRRTGPAKRTSATDSQVEHARSVIARMSESSGTSVGDAVHARQRDRKRLKISEIRQILRQRGVDDSTINSCVERHELEDLLESSGGVGPVGGGAD